MDLSLYTMIHEGYLFAIAVYIDDIMFVRRKCDFMMWFKQVFSSRFKIDDLGPATWIPGCSIIRNRSFGTLLLVSTQYIRDILEEFGTSDHSSVSTTPMLIKLYKLIDA
jgi:hypothetical protein